MNDYGRLSQSNSAVSKVSAIAVAVTVSLLSGLASADDGAFTLKVENDGLGSSDDGHFTSGVEFEWSFAPDDNHWSQRLATALPEGLIGRADRTAYRLTHQIYTPDNIRQRELIEDDRPYAGLVMGGISLYEDVERGNWRQATDLHVDVGMVGPSSQADSLQREVHRVTNSDRPNGWDNQLGDEPILNATFRRQWWHQLPLAGKTFSHGPSVGAALGNLYTYANGGYGVRWGDAGTGLPTVTPNPGNRQSFTQHNGFRWYLFASVEGYFMAHNLTLDGNTFKNSHSVDRREWVGDVAGGVALAWNAWQLTYTAVSRSREFHGQEESDSFGMITLARSF